MNEEDNEVRVVSLCATHMSTLVQHNPQRWSSQMPEPPAKPVARPSAKKASSGAAFSSTKAKVVKQKPKPGLSGRAKLAKKLGVR